MALIRSFAHKVEVKDWPEPSSLAMLFHTCSKAHEEGKVGPWPDLPVDHPVRQYVEAEHRENFNLTLMLHNARAAFFELGYDQQEIEAILAGRELP